MENQVKKIELKEMNKMFFVFGGRLPIGLKLNDISQAELAKKMSVSQTTISNWMGGLRSPDVAQFKKLSDIIGKPMEWFFKDIE